MKNVFNRRVKIDGAMVLFENKNIFHAYGITAPHVRYYE